MECEARVEMTVPKVEMRVAELRKGLRATAAVYCSWRAVTLAPVPLELAACVKESETLVSGESAMSIE